MTSVSFDSLFDSGGQSSSTPPIPTQPFPSCSYVPAPFHPTIHHNLQHFQSYSHMPSMSSLPTPYTQQNNLPSRALNQIQQVPADPTTSATPIDETRVEVYTKKGKPHRIILVGFLFTSVRHSPGGVTTWRCSGYRSTKCPCKLSTRTADPDKLLSRQYSHNHEPPTLPVLNSHRTKLRILSGDVEARYHTPPDQRQAINAFYWRYRTGYKRVK